MRLLSLTLVLALLPGLLAASEPKKEPRTVEIPGMVDLGVSGITFMNPSTTTQVVGKDAASLLDKRVAFPNIALTLCDEGGNSQVILANQPGDPPLAFSVAAVNQGCGDGKAQPRRLKKVKRIESFLGIHLGMSRAELVKRLGSDFTETKVKDYVSIRCGLKDIRQYEFLKAFGRMGYAAEYRLRDDKIFSFKFGFENP